MKKNSIFIMLLCMLHTTICQAHIIKSAMLIATGVYFGTRLAQADFKLDKTQILILKDAESGCDHAISTLEDQCNNQKICKKTIELLKTCKTELQKTARQIRKK